MSGNPKLVTLSPLISQALADFAERCGRDPQDFADEAIARFLSEEEPIAAAVFEGLADFKAGRSFSHEEVTRELDEIIAGAK